MCHGGAGVAMSRLAQAFRADGHMVREYTLDDSGIRRELQPAFLAERAGIFARNGFNRENLFKVSTGRWGRRGIVKEILNARPDAIVMGWVNQGFLSLAQIEALAQSRIPLIWVMHDLWPMTGICHLPLGCEQFREECVECKFCGGGLSHRVWERKHRLYSRTNIKFVAVSSWVEEQARQSSLLKDADIRLIHNVFPIDDYRIGVKEPGLIVMGAARLDDPVKGLPQAIEALNGVGASIGVGARVEFFGEMRSPELFDTLGIDWKWHGPMAKESLVELMSRAQVVMSASQTETFGLTLLEGLASGAVPVSYGSGGQCDIIRHLNTGYLARSGDVGDLTDGLRWALEADLPPAMLREDAARRFSAEAVARKFYALMQ